MAEARETNRMEKNFFEEANEERLAWTIPFHAETFVFVLSVLRNHRRNFDKGSSKRKLAFLQYNSGCSVEDELD